MLLNSSEVCVVEDDLLMRESVRVLLESAGATVTTYSSARAFLRDCEAVDGCLVLDVKMPRMTGLELQAELARRGADIPILFITGHGDIEMAVSAMKAGASEFLVKPFSPEALLRGVHLALESRKKKPIARAEKRIESLTKREREVFQCVVRGETSKAIGRTLGISPRTVEIHRAQIREKLKIRNLAQLVRLAFAADVPYP